MEWWKKAAKRGSVSASFNLGRTYLRGRRVPQNIREAVKWMEFGAKVQQSPFMQNELGMLYYRGKRVPKDYAEAYKWFYISAENGYKSGVELLNRVAKKMSPSQVEKAKNKSIECIKKEYKGC